MESADDRTKVWQSEEGRRRHSLTGLPYINELKFSSLSALREKHAIAPNGLLATPSFGFPRTVAIAPL